MVKRQKTGIQEVVKIDPLKIKRIIEYPKPNSDGVYDLSQIKRYYIFSDIYDVFDTSKTYRTMIINYDSITYTDCGLYDDNGSPLGYLWKTIAPYNNMKMMEDSLLIYRVVRSPERRVFYINVGNLSKSKAEQYMKELMARFKNKMIYDSKSGVIVDRKNVMSMVEDYWIPRREDGKGTEITTLPGGNAMSSIEDVDLFVRKFKKSLNVPVSRLKDEEQPFVFGRTNEIDRDEYRFKKFIDRLRMRFCYIFEDLLKTQLILKNIITEDDWDGIKEVLSWEFAEDNNFVQWKETEVLNSQIESLTAADQLVGKYFDRKWVLVNVMKKSDDEAEKMLELADKDMKRMNDAMAPPPMEGEAPDISAEPGDPEEQ